MWNPNISFRPSYNTSYNIPWYNKRKLRDDVLTDLPPPKILITEEKMVSQLKGIHLSKDYTSHEGNSSSLIEDTSPIIGLEEKQTLPTLVMCDEIRALQKAVEPVLPKQIMDKYQRPTNALVLWQPPVGDLGNYLKVLSQNVESVDAVMANERPSQNLSSNGDIEMNEDDNNNNSPSQDLNGYFTRTI